MGHSRPLIFIFVSSLQLYSKSMFFIKIVDSCQCDQKKSPNVYKSCQKLISLEKW